MFLNGGLTLGELQSVNVATIPAPPRHSWMQLRHCICRVATGQEAHIHCNN
jgi:hypothetical protein